MERTHYSSTGRNLRGKKVNYFKCDVLVFFWRYLHSALTSTGGLGEIEKSKEL